LEEEQQKYYAIDCMPSLMYANGIMVKWILRANIGHYIQFRCLDGIYVYFDQTIHRVPSSRSDIFNSTSLSLLEKRLLTRFITSIQSNEEVTMAGEGSFVQYLEQQKFTEKLRMFVLCGVLFDKDALDSTISIKEASNLIREYLTSLDVYGPSSFLYPIYGVSEWPQAFSR
jgi:RAB protein geranylgeranyltransferase component A